MVMECSVPGCRSRGSKFKLFSVPFTNKLRWDMWLRACPFFRRYQICQLENVRICHLHFLPEHINERQRLTIDAIPILNLRKTRDIQQTEHSVNLEIGGPSNTAHEPYNLTIVRPSPNIKSPTVDKKKSTDIQTDISSSFCEIPPVSHLSQTQLDLPSITDQFAVENPLPLEHYDYQWLCNRFLILRGVASQVSNKNAPPPCYGFPHDITFTQKLKPEVGISV